MTLAMKYLDKLEEGCIEGRAEGELRSLVSQVCKKLAKHKDAATIADELEESEEKIHLIIKVADGFAPDYPVDEICKKAKDQLIQHLA